MSGVEYWTRIVSGASQCFVVALQSSNGFGALLEFLLGGLGSCACFELLGFFPFQDGSCFLEALSVDALAREIGFLQQIANVLGLWLSKESECDAYLICEDCLK